MASRKAIGCFLRVSGMTCQRHDLTPGLPSESELQAGNTFKSVKGPPAQHGAPAFAFFSTPIRVTESLLAFGRNCGVAGYCQRSHCRFHHPREPSERNPPL